MGSGKSIDKGRGRRVLLSAGILRRRSTRTEEQHGRRAKWGRRRGDGGCRTVCRRMRLLSGSEGCPVTRLGGSPPMSATIDGSLRCLGSSLRSEVDILPTQDIGGGGSRRRGRRRARRTRSWWCTVRMCIWIGGGLASFTVDVHVRRHKTCPSASLEFRSAFDASSVAGQGAGAPSVGVIVDFRRIERVERAPPIFSRTGCPYEAIRIVTVCVERAWRRR